MRYRQLAILLSVGLLVTLAGCKKEFLSVTSGTDVPSEVVLGTEQGLQGVVEGLYHSMTDYNSGVGQGYGRGLYAVLLNMDQLSDDAINTRPAYYMGYYRWEQVNDERAAANGALWDLFYDVNKRANIVLENHPNVEFTSEDISHQVKGAAHFFRAFCHFYLVQAYAKRWSTANLAEPGIPLRTSFTLDPLPRATVGEVYDFVNQEIASAIAEFGAVKEQDTRVNAVSLRTAYGLASRIMLVQEKWTEAADYAQKAIDNAGKDCMLLSGDANLHGFNSKQPDWMWSTMRMTDQNDGYHSVWFALGMNSEAASGIQLAINRERYDAMGKDDVRRKWFISLDNYKDMYPYLQSKGVNSMMKMGEKSNSNWETTGQCVKFWTTTPNNRISDLPFMRLAEMYLNKAEAQNESGDLAGAKKTLTDLITTRDAAFAPKAKDKEELRTEIRNHRSVELFFEGFSWFDQKRYARPFNRVKSTNLTILGKYFTDGLLKDNATAEKAVSRNSGVNAINCPNSDGSWDDSQWQWAIPYGEITGANGLVERNIRNQRKE